MSRTPLRIAAVAGLAAVAITQAQPAVARPADPFSYTVSYDDFAVCGEDASLVGRVFLNSRSTGSEGGPYTATFVERTTGQLTVGDDVYRYSQVSKFSEHEVEDGPSGNQLIGWIRLAGSGPLAGTRLEQHIHTVVDANGVARVDTYVSSFCS